MTRQNLLCGLLLTFVTSCGQSPDRRAGPDDLAKQAEDTKPSENSKPSLAPPTTAGEESRPREGNKGPKEAIGRYLSAGFGAALSQEIVKELSSKFNANDSVETKLVAAWFAWHVSVTRGVPPEQIEQLCDGIFLLQPGKAAS